MPYPWTVAIVDDDPEARVSLGSLLRSYGIKTEVFESAEAFLRSPDLSAFDCLITDVHMPKMDGLEMIDVLRRDHSALPVIVISALESRSTSAKAMARGANAFLTKPVNSDELIGWIRRLLDDGGSPPDQTGRA